MICFDDAALARVFIAATAIAPGQRSDWLAGLAARFERETSGACRTRAWRARAKAGRVLLKVVVDEVNLVVALTDLGLLDPVLADDRSALSRAAERVLAAISDASPPAAANLDSIRVSLLLALQPKEPPCPTTSKRSKSSKR